MRRRCARLIEKPDEPARSRHCEGSEPARMSLEGFTTGKAQGSDEPSQENCLSDNHRLTCERWEGDLLALFARKEPLAFWQGVLFVG